MRRIRERPAVAFATMSALAIAAIVVGELIVNGTDIGEWDVLFDSAWLAVIAGLWLARGLPGRFAAMIERLANRGALVRNGQPVTRADIAVVEAELADEARGAEQRWGIVIGVLIALSFVAAKSSVLPAHPALGDVLVSVVGAAALGTVGGFLAGRVIGRMLCYSTLGRSLERRDISFQASPGHVEARQVSGLSATTSCGSRCCSRSRPSSFSSGRCCCSRPRSTTTRAGARRTSSCSRSRSAWSGPASGRRCAARIAR